MSRIRSHETDARESIYGCLRPGCAHDTNDMKNLAAGALVFLGGFILMVLEVIGARFLAKDFGSSFHVWVSQIGVVLIALALGYYMGGALADRWQRLRFLAFLLVPAGLGVLFIPEYAGRLIDLIIRRHPV